MSWKKVENVLQTETIYYNTITKKVIKISFREQHIRKSRRFQRINKIRKHKQLLFQIKMYIALREKDKYIINGNYFDPEIADKLYNMINCIDIKKYSFSDIRYIMKVIFIRELNVEDLLNFLAELYNERNIYSITHYTRFDTTCFIMNHIHFFKMFDMIGNLTFSNFYQKYKYFKKNIDIYYETGETEYRTWKKEYDKHTREIEKNHIEESLKNYHEKVINNKYFSRFLFGR